MRTHHSTRHALHAHHARHARHTRRSPQFPPRPRTAPTHRHSTDILFYAAQHAAGTFLIQAHNDDDALPTCSCSFHPPAIQPSFCFLISHFRPLSLFLHCFEPIRESSHPFTNSLPPSHGHKSTLRGTSCAFALNATPRALDDFSTHCRISLLAISNYYTRRIRRSTTPGRAPASVLNCFSKS